MMSLNSRFGSRSECVNKFSRIEELKEWLSRFGVNTAVWGKEGHKSVNNLWQELQKQDAILQETPPMRRVNVVQILVRRGNRLLLETVQELATGDKRYRNLPPAEKIKSGETPLDAAARGLYEELGITRDRIQFDPSSHSTRTFISESPSYPGLLSQYTFHDIEATVEGLSDEDFWHDNLSYQDGDPVKRHFWAWRTDEQRNLATSTLHTEPLNQDNAIS